MCFTTFVIRVPKVYTRSAVLWLMGLRVNLILTAFDYFASGQFDLSVNLPSFRLLSCHFYFFPFHKTNSEDLEELKGQLAQQLQ